MMSEPAALTSRIVAAFGDSYAEQVDRAVFVLGTEQAGVLFAEAQARAARDGASRAPGASAEALSTDGGWPGRPARLLPRPSGKLVGFVGFFVVADHLVALALAGSIEFVAYFGGWTYRPIAWLLWPVVLTLSLACLVAAARSRSEGRWAWWLAVWVAPWAWLVLATAFLGTSAS